MAIKMRNNNKDDSVCCECGQNKKQVLDMFDLCIGGNLLTICDLCNDALFRKTLKANCYTNGRVKNPHDIAIINKRGRDRWKAKVNVDDFLPKYDKEEVEQIGKKVNSWESEGNDE